MHDIFRLLQSENALLSSHTIMKLTALSGGIVFGPCFSVFSSLSICFKKDITIPLAFVPDKTILFFTTQSVI